MAPLAISARFSYDADPENSTSLSHGAFAAVMVGSIVGIVLLSFFIVIIGVYFVR
jgi:hypothetical protein